MSPIVGDAANQLNKLLFSNDEDIEYCHPTPRAYIRFMDMLVEQYRIKNLPILRGYYDL